MLMKTKIHNEKVNKYSNKVRKCRNKRVVVLLWEIKCTEEKRQEI